MLNINLQIRKESVFIALILSAALHGILFIGMAFPWHQVKMSPSHGYFQTDTTLSKGVFLVASRNIKDPNFSETVILLIKYDRKGAMGLVINRPTKIRLSKVLPQIKGLLYRMDTLYIGGPVARSNMLMLIQSKRQPKESHRVFDNVYVSSSPTALQQMIDDAKTGEDFRVFSGYAGWTHGQLYREISAGGWHVLQADAETIFNKAPSRIWPELILQSSVLHVDINRKRLFSAIQNGAVHESF